MDIFSFWKLQTSTAALMLETQTVMALRVLGLSGVLPSRRDESIVMVAEKAPALARSFAAANAAMWRGNTPDKVYQAAMAPLTTKVRANRKRLLR